MRKPLIAVAIAVVLVAAVVSGRACSGSKRASAPVAVAPGVTAPAPSSSAAADLPTQKQLYDDIRRKGLTPERAKLLFSMVIGPLPGVTVPAGGRDPDVFCGTRAVGYLYQVWSSLTQDQRDAASKLIDRSTTASASSGRPPTLTLMPAA